MTGKAMPLRAAVRACDSLADFEKLITCRGQRQQRQASEADNHKPISIIDQPLFVENPKIKRDLILNQGTKVSEESSRWEGVVDVL